MPKHDPAPIEGVKPFTDSLRMLEGGHLIEDCSDALRELNARLADHTATHGSAKGKLILTISLHHKGGIVIAEADVTTKAPKISREQTALWLTPGNNLAPSDPRQLELGKGPRSLPGDAPPRATNDIEAPPRAVKG